MSNYTTAYNALLTVIPTLTGFTTKTKIPNPMSLEDNSYQFLRNGWGLIATSDSESDFQVLKQNRVTHGFTVRITEQLLKSDHNATAFDTVSLSLKEDAITLKEELLKDDQLSVATSIERVDHTGTSGIEQVNLDKHNLLYVDVNFTIEISEDRS